MDVIDAIAQHTDVKDAYTALFHEYRSISAQLAKNIATQEQQKKEADYKQYLLDELLQAGFKEHEIEDADQQLKQLSHAERILGVLQVSRAVLDEGEQPMVNELKRIGQQLQSIADVMPDSAALQQRIISAYAELKDIASELEVLESKVSLDPALMQQLQERVDTGYKLLKKHSLQTTAELLVLQAQLDSELQVALHMDETIQQLTAQKEEKYTALMEVAQILSANRKKIAPVIAEKVTALLALVGMPNARLQVDVKHIAAPDAHGIDDVQFLLDANKSGQFLPVHKAASGGEMSRIMLCIKSLTAKAMQLPTLIFDEVDTGISGEAARQVGVLLADLGQYHQIICITHQPQVAAKGTTHLHVYKEEAADGKIKTKLRVLKPEERVLAIARMIGGEQPSAAAMENARELVAL
jgi:DNA repair protein RecN (Recombination protein N)